MRPKPFVMAGFVGVFVFTSLSLFMAQAAPTSTCDKAKAEANTTEEVEEDPALPRGTACGNIVTKVVEYQCKKVVRRNRTTYEWVQTRIINRSKRTNRCNNGKCNVQGEVCKLGSTPATNQQCSCYAPPTPPTSTKDTLETFDERGTNLSDMLSQ